MTPIANRCIAILFAMLIATPMLAQAQRRYDQVELDQMLAPIALYPDSLLTQVLMSANHRILRPKAVIRGMLFFSFLDPLTTAA